MNGIPVKDYSQYNIKSLKNILRILQTLFKDQNEWNFI